MKKVTYNRTGIFIFRIVKNMTDCFKITLKLGTVAHILPQMGNSNNNLTPNDDHELKFQDISAVHDKSSHTTLENAKNVRLPDQI